MFQGSKCWQLTHPWIMIPLVFFRFYFRVRIMHSCSMAFNEKAGSISKETNPAVEPTLLLPFI